MSLSPNSVGIVSILFMTATLLICVGLPVCLAIWAKRKYKKDFSLLPLLGGALGFFVSQVVFRMPLTSMALPLFGWYREFMKMQWPYLIFVCFTAGLVEEPARFIVFSIMKKRRTYPAGLSYGIGHGGIEAVLLVGISYVFMIFYAVMMNAGVLAMVVPAAQISEITASLGMPSYYYIVAGIERIFAVTLHIALSLVVLKGFQTRRKALYLALSIILHGSANLAALSAAKLGAAVMQSSPQLGGILFSEGVLLVIAALSFLYIMKQAKGWRRAAQLPEEPAAA